MTPPLRVPAARVGLATAERLPRVDGQRLRDRRAARATTASRSWSGPTRSARTSRRCGGCRTTTQIPILALHAPCLVITQRVWGTDPWAKLVRAKDAAEECGAETVVVHPPFRWQREYARQFVGGIQQMADETDVRFAVENMFPLRARGREVVAVRARLGPDRRGLPSTSPSTCRTRRSASPTRWAWRPRWATGSRTCTSPTATARPATSTSSPAAATSRAPSCSRAWPCRGFDGLVVVEVNTRQCEDRAEREADLAEALAFTRLNLAAPAERRHERLPALTYGPRMDVLRTPTTASPTCPASRRSRATPTTSDGLRHGVRRRGPGRRPVVLLLHGEPSWSYLYRKVIPVLVDAGLPRRRAGPHRLRPLATSRPQRGGLHLRAARRVAALGRCSTRST